MKEIIEESLLEITSSLGIELKGKSSEIAECIYSDIKLSEPTIICTASKNEYFLDKEDYKQRFINDVKNLPLCRSCKGTGLHIDRRNTCNNCKGTGRDLSCL